MRRIVMATAALALVAQGAAVSAQQAKGKAAAPAARGRTAPPPSAAELKQANDTLSLFVSAFNSKDVPDQTKAGLLLCLYGNPLGKIARSHAQAMASDKSINARSPTQRLLVLAAMCKAPLPAPAEPKRN